ncbi:MAG: Ig-like domain-containing protein [Myxococcota bacterium]
MLRASRCISTTLLSLGLVAPGVALADNCARPDLAATFPIDGAANVPLNASLSASYEQGADYLDEPVTLSFSNIERSLNARFDTSESRLIVDEPGLEPNTAYTLTWPALRGLSTAGHGLGKTISFTTGASVDSAPPEFEGLEGVSWDLVHPRDECTDDLEPRLRFRLTIGAANDDGGRDSLALMLFQTQGPAVNDSAPRFLTGRALPSGAHADVDLTVDDATGRVCFATLVRDLVGNVSATGNDTHCVKTTAPPIFYGCAFPKRPPGGSALDLLLVLGVASLFGRRRWRAP